MFGSLANSFIGGPTAETTVTRRPLRAKAIALLKPTADPPPSMNAVSESTTTSLKFTRLARARNGFQTGRALKSDLWALTS
jgi:hypothetical protein